MRRSFYPLFVLPGAFCATQWYTLNVVNKHMAPDGFNRSTVVANGQFPGPLISAQKGDSFAVNVVDQLTDTSMPVATTIHWHGLFQVGSAYEDGTATVTQCPISPEKSFLYQFGTQQQTGTYWYHSHFSVQYCDGLRGALVIYDPEDPYRHMYDVDDESTVITLGDWYHLPSPASFKALEVPESTLINGKGRQPGGPATPLAVVNVKKGLRYRFRLINFSCFSPFTVQIDQHNMTVIEADGVETEPVTVDSLKLWAGQRYSIIVTADQPINNYWIRANTDAPVAQGFIGGINSAILRYAGAPDRDPTTIAVSGTELQEQQLHPLVNPGSPGGDRPADKSFTLNIDLDPISQLYTINGYSYTTPPLPVLLQILSGTYSAQELLPNGTVYTLPPNSLIEVTVPGGSPLYPHPFHLHGHNFDVIRSAGQQEPNYVNSPRRDVVNTGGPGDNVTIRFVTDNPGPWFFHCHIDWHLQAALAIVFAEDAPAIKASQRPPETWKELCPEYEALPASEQ